MENQLKIFKDEVAPISLREIYSYTFDDFKSKGYLLNSDYEDIILMYYKKVYKNEYIIPFYHCLPTLNSLTKDKKFKFLVVRRGEDSILLVYKVIQILKTRQIRFFDIPISLNGIEENQYELICDLSKKDFVRFCYSFPFTDWFNTAYGDRYPQYDNYYKSRSWYDSKCNCSWMRQKGVSSILKNKDFDVSLSKSVDFNDAKFIRENFNSYIESNNGIVSKNDDNEFYNVIRNENKLNNVYYFTVYYKGGIIMLTVVLVVKELNVAYELYNMKKRGFYEDDIEKKVLEHNISEKTSFFIFYFLKYIQRLYVLGYMPSEKRLAKHKANIYQNCLKYYIE